MKHFLLLLIISTSIVSCDKINTLQQDFNCKTQRFSKTEIITDVQDKFTVTVPKHWKTSLFFNNYQSQIQSADTLKQLSETYILITALNNGNLEVNDAFKDKKLKQYEEDHFKNAKFKFITYNDKPSIWFLAKGEKLNKTYHYFQLFVKNSPTDYFEFSTEIYGDDLVDERLCESIALLKKVEILK
ncbi:MAG: hypothetical protein V3U80_00145 [Flavobacteriaceae bacterium]